MTKRLQNRLAESRQLMTGVMGYGLMVWLASGIVHPYYTLESSGPTNFAWIQLLCFILSATLLAVLNNTYSLIRVFSRTVSSTFIMLTCATCFQFNSMSGAIVSLCMSAFFLLFFHTYQDKESPGWTYYAFLCLGLGSLVFVRLFVYVPLLWLMMAFQLNSVSVRTVVASILGLITPYWFIIPYFLVTGNTEWLIHHFQPLVIWDLTPDYSHWTLNQVVTLALIVLVGATGAIHCLRNYYADKVRTRLFYSIFNYLMLATLVLTALQPALYDELTRILIICVSPLAAHFLTLTHTRLTNISVLCCIAITLLITLVNLWMPSLSF